MSHNDAKERYAALGVDTDAAIEKLKTVPVSLHCWQGDDVRGFDTDPNKPLTGGIQTTCTPAMPFSKTANGRTGTNWNRSISQNGRNSAKPAVWAVTSTRHFSLIRNATR